MYLPDWPDLLRDPPGGAHYVQAYRDAAFLCEAVAEYAGSGLRRGEAVILIARPEHAARFRGTGRAMIFAACLSRHSHMVASRLKRPICRPHFPLDTP